MWRFIVSLFLYKKIKYAFLANQLYLWPTCEPVSIHTNDTNYFSFKGWFQVKEIFWDTAKWNWWIHLRQDVFLYWFLNEHPLILLSNAITYVRYLFII